MPEQENLKTDLLTLDPKEFYMKHIIKSHNWYFSEYLKVPAEDLVDKMDFFKEIVSSNLHINFHNLQIVGSAKTGYSLSPKKVLRPFHDEIPGIPPSDIDIAIVSQKLFENYWEKARHIKGIQYQPYYLNLTKSIFRGYINDKDLVEIGGVSREWDELIDPINVTLQDKLGFIHPITYRVYRSWEDLEDYQLGGILKAKRTLEGSEHV